MLHRSHRQHVRVGSLSIAWEFRSSGLMASTLNHPGTPTQRVLQFAASWYSLKDLGQLVNPLPCFLCYISWGWCIAHGFELTSLQGSVQLSITRRSAYSLDSSIILVFVFSQSCWNVFLKPVIFIFQKLNSKT